MLIESDTQRQAQPSRYNWNNKIAVQMSQEYDQIVSLQSHPGEALGQISADSLYTMTGKKANKISTNLIRRNTGDAFYLSNPVE